MAKLRLLLLLAIAFVIFPSFASAVDITGCTTLSSAGATYYLKNDITWNSPTADCLVITASNVKLYCAKTGGGYCTISSNSGSSYHAITVANSLTGVQIGQGGEDGGTLDSDTIRITNHNGLAIQIGSDAQVDLYNLWMENVNEGIYSGANSLTSILNSYFSVKGIAACFNGCDIVGDPNRSMLWNVSITSYNTSSPSHCGGYKQAAVEVAYCDQFYFIDSNVEAKAYMPAVWVQGSDNVQFLGSVNWQNSYGSQPWSTLAAAANNAVELHDCDSTYIQDYYFYTSSWNSQTLKGYPLAFSGTTSNTMLVNPSLVHESPLSYVMSLYDDTPSTSQAYLMFYQDDYGELNYYSDDWFLADMDIYSKTLDVRTLRTTQQIDAIKMYSGILEMDVSKIGTSSGFPDGGALVDFYYAGGLQLPAVYKEIAGVEYQCDGRTLADGTSCSILEDDGQNVSVYISGPVRPTDSGVVRYLVRDAYSAGENIYDCEDLQAINDGPHGYYKLMNDIDCSDSKYWNGGLGFDPISDFDGVLISDSIEEGFAYRISNLYINRPSEYMIGLFEDFNGTAEGIQIYNADITGGALVGTFAGMVSDGADIESVYVRKSSVTAGELSGVSGAGGFAGWIDSEYPTLATLGVVGVISTKVTGSGNIVGGFAGRVSDAMLIAVWVRDAEVSGGQYVGGFAGMFGIGDVASEGVVQNGYVVDSTITCEDDCAGFVGMGIGDPYFLYTYVALTKVEDTSEPVDPAAFMNVVAAIDKTLRIYHTFTNVPDAEYTVQSVDNGTLELGYFAWVSDSTFCVGGETNTCYTIDVSDMYDPGMISRKWYSYGGFDAYSPWSHECDYKGLPIFVWDVDGWLYGCQQDGVSAKDTIIRISDSKLAKHAAYCPDEVDNVTVEIVSKVSGEVIYPEGHICFQAMRGEIDGSSLTCFDTTLPIQFEYTAPGTPGDDNIEFWFESGGNSYTGILTNTVSEYCLCFEITVTSEAGVPIPDAVVYASAEGYETSVVANEQGVVLLKELPEHTLSVKAAAYGYSETAYSYEPSEFGMEGDCKQTQLKLENTNVGRNSYANTTDYSFTWDPPRTTKEVTGGILETVYGFMAGPFPWLMLFILLLIGFAVIRYLFSSVVS